MSEIFKRKFSYKLDIHIMPNWQNLYKKICNPESETEWAKALEQKIEKSQKDNGTSLWGRNYYFTEYYDSVSGLTSRFQNVFLQNGQQHFYPVDEFSEQGYIFESDGELNLSENDKERDNREKLSVDISDHFIRYDIFEKHISAPKFDFDYEEESYLFQFPLSSVFNFLFALSQRFNNVERNVIIKWPDQVEKKIKELGIDYQTHPDYFWEPFDIEKHDKEFFEKWGKPKISIYSNSTFQTGYCSSENVLDYGVKLKIFRPDDNDRITWEN